MTQTTQRSALTRNTAIANSRKFEYIFVVSTASLLLFEQRSIYKTAIALYSIGCILLGNVAFLRNCNMNSHYSTRIRSVQMSVIACTDSAEITKRTPAVYKLLYTNTKSWFRFICCFASFHFIRAGDKDLTAENRRHTDTHTKDHIKIYSAIFQFIVAQSGEMKATTNNSL